jgi:ribosomal protein S18 acetylase RimI-like enzyme
LAQAAGAGDTLRATAEDWLRDAFGTAARFGLFVAENAGAIIGMVAYNEIYMTALGGPVFAIQDLFVEPEHRKFGAGRALVAEVAAAAIAKGIPLIELNVRDDNPARKFYRRAGFRHLRECLTYAIGGEAMLDLALAATAHSAPSADAPLPPGTIKVCEGPI